MFQKELLSLKRNLHGTGNVLFRWDHNGTHLATCGQNRRLHIFDRTGQLVDEHTLPQPKPALQLEWDNEGEHLAVIQDGSSVLCLWSVHSKKLKQVEMSGVKDPSFMTWSRVGGELAVGTQKGNLLIYNVHTLKSISVAGKHSKKITCGAWNTENKLALASLDRMLTISDEKGELVEQAKLKYDPYDIQFSAQKVDDNTPPSESTVSINMGRQTVLLYNMHDSDNPVELAFQSKYGEIVQYWWFGDGYLMIGFSRGYLIAISTHMREIGEELQSMKMFESALTSVCYSTALNKLAVSGDDGVKLVDMSDWKEMKTDQVRFGQDEGDVDSMAWTNDGQILTVSTTGGYVFNYLTSIPQLSAAHGSHLLYLSSLRSLSLFDASSAADPDSHVQSWDVAVEPTFLALSGRWLGCGMNNHAWYYTLDSHVVVQEKSYMGSVKAIACNDTWAAVLCDGKVVVHTIAPTEQVQRDNPEVDAQLFEDRVFPQSTDDTSVIVAMTLTDDYLIYCTDKGLLVHYYLAEAAAINEHRHECPILSFSSNPSGTRVVFIDQKHRGFLYSPVDDQCVDIPSFPASIDSVLFDPLDTNTFVAVDAKTGRNVVTFIYAPQTTKGPTVTKLTNTKLPFSFQPALFYDGSLHGQKAGGGLSSLLLSSHDSLSVIQKGAKRTPEKLRQGLTQMLALNRLRQAWEIATIVKQKEQMLLLARKACDQLELELAIRVYREMKETAMVLALQEVEHEEDKQLLAGHICMLSADYNRAATLFLSSSKPTTALQMRRDLLQWDQALKLALTVQPDAIPAIAREYAAQLEVKGEYGKALDMYQRSYNEAHPSQSDYNDNRQLSRGGIARMTLRLGDLQKGQQLAYDSGDKQLMKECAAILEQMKQQSDAADMYSRAEQYEKAAALYLSIRHFAKAAPLMQRITTPKLHQQFAKAKEAEGAYREAVAAYLKAKDVDAVIRLYLQQLDEPDKAFELGRASKSSVGAALIAKYCIEHVDIASAVEFLFIAKRHAEAYTMAAEKKCMDIYAQVLGEQGTTEEYEQIAAYYEQQGEFSKAAHYHALLNDYSRSLKLYLQTPQPTAEQLYAAIDVVRKAQAEPGGELLVRQLHDYLIGDSDGVVKDLNYIFRLYLSIGEYAQAANTAVLIAAQEQQCGQYNAAHAILLNIAQELRGKRLSIPNELKKSLTLLHSYRLAKLHSQKGDHASAARMLVRVARNISKFPTHTVPILTSTVIECQRAGLKRSAFEYASALMRPEYRQLVDAKYRKPIEAFVRRPVMDEEDESHSACPFCAMEIPDSMLECVGCRNDIPMCAVTGRHMRKDDWSECPKCKFACLYSKLVERAGEDGSCVMCNATIAAVDVVKVEDVQAYLYNKMDDQKKDGETDKLTGRGSVSAADGDTGGVAGSPRDYQSAVDIDTNTLF